MSNNVVFISGVLKSGSLIHTRVSQTSRVTQIVRNCSVGDPRFDPCWGRSTGEGNGYIYIYIHIYIYLFFSNYFSHLDYYRISSRVSVGHSRSLLVIYF